MRYFTSDTHFYHTNIIKYCNRPFATTHEMNEAIIANWNSIVKPEDTVYHMGDVIFCGTEMAGRLIPRLNGYKILVQGNHDKQLDKMIAMGFQEAHTHLQIQIDGKNVWLSHYPYKGTPDPYHKESDKPDRRGKRLHDDGSLLLCGHVHDSWKLRNHIINVGVDVWDFKPVTEDQIIETAKSLMGSYGVSVSTEPCQGSGTGSTPVSSAGENNG